MGNKKSVIRPEQLADKLRFGDVQWADNGKILVWLESRSDRGVLVAGDPSGCRFRDLNRQYPVRARVGYGGGDFSVSDRVLLYVSDRKLFRQDLAAAEPVLVYESDTDIASPVMSPCGRWIAFIESWKDKERLAMAAAEGGEPLDFHTGSDFNMQPAWHPSGKYLAWITWDNPSMPWEKSRVRTAEVSDGTCLREIFPPETGTGSAAFQPEFSPDGKFLACVDDRSGWANLRIYSFPSMEPVAELREECEHSQPAWIQGMRTYAWSPDSRSIYLIRNRKGFSSLARWDLESSSLSVIGGELEKYSSLSQVTVSADGNIALTGASPAVPPQVLVSGSGGSVRVLRKSLPGDFKPDHEYFPVPVSWQCSEGEAGFGSSPGGDGELAKQECHGLYFSPEGGSPDSTGETRLNPPPAVIRIHGGPTSSYSAEFDPDVRFYTSRGYAVLSLNYRGSTGYGKEYRELLSGKWGVTDVVDVRDAADFLVAGGLADQERIFLDGGSAGGFTLLLALIRFAGTFRGGICRYGVADLLKLTEDTHRFEAHYLDSLIGKLPQDRDRYVERSPVTHIEKLTDPIALFQGSDDKVVPLDQAEVIAGSLAARGVSCLFRVFEGEGHGWRKKETIKAYFEAVEDFLREHS